jgi:hypothetical protein
MLVNVAVMEIYTSLMKWQDKFVYKLIHEREGGNWNPPPSYNSQRRSMEGLAELYERASLKLGTCIPGACRGDRNPKKQHFKRRCCTCGGARCVSEHNMTYGFTAQVCLKKMRSTITAMRKEAQKAQEAGEKLTTTSPEPEEMNSGGSSETELKELLEYTLSTDEEDVVSEAPSKGEEQEATEKTPSVDTPPATTKVPHTRSAEQVEREKRLLQEYIGLGSEDRGQYMATNHNNVFVVAHGRAEGKRKEEKKEEETESSSDSSEASSTSVSSPSQEGDVSPCDHNNCDGWRKAIRYKKELKGVKQEAAHLRRKLNKLKASYNMLRARTAPSGGASSTAEAIMKKRAWGPPNATPQTNKSRESAQRSRSPRPEAERNAPTTSNHGQKPSTSKGKGEQQREGWDYRPWAAVNQNNADSTRPGGNPYYPGRYRDGRSTNYMGNQAYGPLMRGRYSAQSERQWVGPSRAVRFCTTCRPNPHGPSVCQHNRSQPTTRTHLMRFPATSRSPREETRQSQGNPSRAPRPDHEWDSDRPVEFFHTSTIH